jgi:ABC-type nitrate/sulfonate/bicarbonate transport system substrate-binding protein
VKPAPGLSALLLLAALLAPGHAAAQAVEQPVFDLPAVRDPQLGAQIAIANHFNYWKDEGLTVTVRWQQSGGDIITLMASGQQGVAGGGSFAQIVLGGQKLPVRTIAPLADIAGTQGFVLSPKTKLASPKELEGKKLAHTQGNSQVLILAKLAKQYGFDPSKVTLVNMQPSEGVVAASKGDVDGLLGWQPNLYRLIKAGGVLYTTATVSYITGKPEPLTGDKKLLHVYSFLLASDTWIKEKPNTLKALLRSLKRANDLLVKDREKALDALEKELRIDDREALRVMTDANRYTMAFDDDAAMAVRSQSEWALEIKRIPAAVAPEDVFSTGLLAEVDPKLVVWKPKR